MSVRAELKKLVKDLLRQGWREEFGRHRKLYHPKGGMVVMSISPSCHHAVRNIQGDINRIKKSHGELV